MTPERKYIYEVFKLLGAHIVKTHLNTFIKTYVRSVEKMISTELKW